MRYDRAALKQAAKQTIRETRPKVWMVTLVYLLLASFLPTVVSNIVPNPFSDLANVIAQDPTLMETHPEYVLQLMGASLGGGALLSIFVSVVISLYRMVMNYGYVGYALKVRRRESTGYGDIFSGFSLAGKAIGASIMVSVFTFLWLLLIAIPCMILLMLALTVFYDAELIAILMFVVYLVFFVIGMLWVTSRYALTPYYIMSQPEMGILGAITASKTAMKGNIRKYVALELSFLGWTLLSALIMWVILLIGCIITFAGNAAAIQAAMLQDPTTLLMTVGGPMILFVVLAYAASLPLNLWVTAYTNVSYAAFFDVFSGYEPPQPYEGYPYDGVPPIPPAPPEETVLMDPDETVSEPIRPLTPPQDVTQLPDDPSQDATETPNDPYRQ